jgi:hypothetical protein
MADPAFAVEPLEAIDFLRRKLDVPTSRWTDVWQEAHDMAGAGRPCSVLWTAQDCRPQIGIRGDRRPMW